MRFELIEEHREEYGVAHMCRALQVSSSGYYAWCDRPPSAREMANRELFEKIEAVYVFPLPNRAAVDDMEIHVGERTIKGLIKKRDEARRIYEEAKRAGHVAALLDQERPNIFTQSVANILPGNRIEVKIRYFEALPYVDNDYTFSFPMVVGPRFIPGSAKNPGQGERGWSPDTTDVPDASRITPPVLKPGQRSGHDISLEVNLDAGTELVELASPSHKVDVERRSKTTARIVLRIEDSIPNKDFILRYRLDANAPQMLFLPHRKEGDGYFMLLIQPEAKPAPDTIAPKEMVFVVDCSGSMSGFPMEKVKEAMRHSLQNLNRNDTFQIVRFSNRAETFAPAPVSATKDNIQRGLGLHRRSCRPGRDDHAGRRSRRSGSTQGSRTSPHRLLHDRRLHRKREPDPGLHAG